MNLSIAIPIVLLQLLALHFTLTRIQPVNKKFNIIIGKLQILHSAEILRSLLR
jgi:hypothetical protein